jgi:DNA-binding MarR family transcriptional regulator
MDSTRGCCVPRLLLHAQGRLGISPTEFNVLLHLLEHWWEADKPPHPKIETIGRRMNKSPRMVLRYLNSLEKRGLIRRIRDKRLRKAEEAASDAA